MTLVLCLTPMTALSSRAMTRGTETFTGHWPNVPYVLTNTPSTELWRPRNHTNTCLDYQWENQDKIQKHSTYFHDDSKMFVFPKINTFMLILAAFWYVMTSFHYPIKSRLTFVFLNILFHSHYRSKMGCEKLFAFSLTHSVQWLQAILNPPAVGNKSRHIEVSGNISRSNDTTETFKCWSWY